MLLFAGVQKCPSLRKGQSAKVTKNFPDGQTPEITIALKIQDKKRSKKRFFPGMANGEALQPATHRGLHNWASDTAPGADIFRRFPHR